MNRLIARRLALTLLLLPCGALAQEGDEALSGAEVVFLGEVHDNPAHHERQSALVGELKPTALVFEMLTTDQSALIHPEDLENEAGLAEKL